ncbi:TetR/AcrR family transcriptional regulator [Actinokineospora bangkokensis]|uniref:HTH tetR-type domain-containing protein n=1 Tax=Actinokineospora bangkokensis TaxID=1193682 RepID=A0A1Q9LM45_9PSEU|nr:TetR/AcrR family transcriptional regulator [Actinokineospora bangkokensis]OLR93079.1 hypothetical protein BJP25_19215 [Actinokineospora bangkokensis]
MTSTAEPGRRERKKAATRAAIADAALRLFLARGYQAVSLKDVAEAADVAVTTIFKHFPGKEALVLDESADVERGLLAAVTERPPGTPVLDALRGWALGSRSVRQAGDPDFARFRELVAGTPELDAYAQRTWLAHAEALAAALLAAEPAHLTPAQASWLAHAVLAACDTARRAQDPAAAVDEVFALLRSGWPH